MPSLFRRRTAEVGDPPIVAEAPETADNPDNPDSPDSRPAGSDAEAAPSGPLVRGYTPSKRELGRETPKRPSPHLRRPGGPEPRSRKDLTKEERQEVRQGRRERRRAVSEGIRRGDQRYLPARDQGAERALVRDVVDSRRNAGTWFFGGALVIIIASSLPIPAVVVVSNAMFVVLVMAMVIDSVLLCRRVGRLVRARHPDTTQSMRGLYFYAVMRSMQFRKLRLPQPRVRYGDRV